MGMHAVAEAVNLLQKRNFVYHFTSPEKLYCMLETIRVGGLNNINKDICFVTYVAYPL